MQKDRRNWAAEQKLQAIMPVIRGEVGLTEQARRLKVAESQLYRWRDQANGALLEAFSSNGPSGHERELEEKVAELERLCGKQAAQIELLKKHDCCSERRSADAVGRVAACSNSGGVLPNDRH